MAADCDLQQKLTPLISVLRSVLELRVQAIEAAIPRMADFSRFAGAVSDVPRSGKSSMSTFVQTCGRNAADNNTLARHSWPPLPRHVTIEVSGGLIAMLECRLDTRVVRFRFYSKASGVRVLQMLVAQGALSASDQFALATRIKFYSLPESTEPVFEHRVTFEASFGKLRHVADGLLQSVLLLNGGLIKEHHEWIM